MNPITKYLANRKAQTAIFYQIPENQQKYLGFLQSWSLIYLLFGMLCILSNAIYFGALSIGIELAVALYLRKEYYIEKAKL